MNKKLTLDQENMHEVQLVQALCGVITPNIRMVSILFEQTSWKIKFVLEKEDADDRDEIEDFKTEFDALLGRGDIDYEVQIVVSSELIPLPEPQTRVVFRRKEKELWISVGQGNRA